MISVLRRISSELVDKITVNWSAMKLIRRLRNSGCKIAICTGKDHYRTVDILRYYCIEDLFDVLICADDVLEPKPSAMPILSAMEKLGANQQNTVMIGDGYNDIKSAINASVTSILTLWYGDQNVPREADYTVSSIDELEQIILHMKELYINIIFQVLSYIPSVRSQ